LKGKFVKLRASAKAKVVVQISMRRKIGASSEEVKACAAPALPCQTRPLAPGTTIAGPFAERGDGNDSA
jgi:hypothetical protein